MDLIRDNILVSGYILNRIQAFTKLSLKGHFEKTPLYE